MPRRAVLGVAMYVLVEALRGLAPVGLIWTTALVAAGELTDVRLILLLFAGWLGVAQIADAVSAPIRAQAMDLTSLLFRARWAEAVARWPTLDIHEDSELVARKEVAERAARQAHEIVPLVGFVAYGVLSIVPLVALLATRAGVMAPLVVLAGAIPLAIVQAWAYTKIWGSEARSVDLRLRSEGLERMLVDRDHAKDLRTFEMRGWAIQALSRAESTLLARSARIRVGATAALVPFAVLSGLAGVVGLVLLTGGRSALDAGTVVLALGILLQLRGAVDVLVGGLTELVRIGLPLRAYRAFVRQAPPPPTGRCEGRDDPAVGFRELTFSYPGHAAPVLRDQTFLVPGGVTLVVGPNGAGKSTCMKLLAGLYAPTHGCVERGSWHHASVLEQEVGRWPLSVRENLDAGAGIEDDALWAALEVVRLHERVGRMGRGLDETLYRDTVSGTSFSGGEWQRLALARVMVDANRRPSLVILDEPTSSIDAVDELPLLRRVLAHLSGHVVFLVTHRLQCVQFADQVVLVEPGGVITVGPHVELKARSAWYRAACDAQAQSFDAIGR